MTNQGVVLLAEKLGVGVEALWQVARSMPVYNALQNVPWAVLWAILTWVAWKKVVPWVDEKTEGGYDPEPARMIVRLFAIVPVLITAAYAVGCVSHLLGMVNPDAYALTMILSALKQR